MTTSSSLSILIPAGTLVSVLTPTPAQVRKGQSAVRVQGDVHVPAVRVGDGFRYEVGGSRYEVPAGLVQAYEFLPGDEEWAG